MKKRPFYKKLSLLLALSLLMGTSPFGQRSAYATEEQSSGTETVRTLQETDAVYSSTVTGSSITVNEEKTDIKELKVGIAPLAAATPTIWKVSNVTELQDALSGIADGDTIELTANIDYNDSIIIYSKTITFDVGSFTLNVLSSTGTTAGIGLQVNNSGHVLLAGSGQLNVIQTGGNASSGVNVLNGSTATVTNIKVSVGSGSAFGAYASGSGSAINVLGNITVTGEGACGAKTFGDGQITVDGYITASSYINIGTVYKAKSSGVEDPSKPGYLKYSTPPIESGIVWVKKQASVFQIGTMGYDSLPDAFAAAVTGDTVKLLQNASYTNDIDFEAAVKISGKNITLDMNGHDLEINNSLFDGLELAASAQLNVIGSGNLRINSKFDGLDAVQSKFSSDSTVNVIIVSSRGQGISADKAAIDILKGDVTGNYNVIYVLRDSTITVKGPITATGTGSNHGINMQYTGNTISVDSITITSGEGAGIYIEDGGSVTVGSPTKSGSVMGKGNGIWTRQGSTRAYVTVYGDVEGGTGINAGDNAEIKVYGNVKATSSNKTANGIQSLSGITSSPANLIEVYGNVEGPNGAYVSGVSSRIKVTGNVTAIGTVTAEQRGVYAAYGTLEIGGNVSVNAPGCIGAEAQDYGEIMIDGSIHAGQYVKVQDSVKTIDEQTLPSTKTGYRTYNKATSNVWVKDRGPVSTYLLTVANGTGSGSYISGTLVNITANPPAAGQAFEKWITDNGGSFGDAGNPDTTFTMPSNAVTITATYKAVPVATYNVVVNSSYAGTSGAGSYAQGTAVTIHAGSQSGYLFIGWTSSDGIAFADAGSATTTFVMPAKNVTVTANWSYISSGGSSSGGGYTPPATSNIITVNKSNQPTIASMDVNATFVTNRNATVTITDTMAKTLIENAQTKAKENGKTSDGIGVVLNSLFSKPASSITITVEAAAIDRLEREGTKLLSVNNPLVSFTLDTEAIKEVNRQSAGNLSFHASPIPNLSDTKKTLIGSRPMFRVTISYQKDDMATYVSDFKKGTIILGIAYTPTMKENSGNLYGVYMDEKSKLTLLTNSSYVNKRLIFSQNKLSAYGYGVGYKVPAPSFTDTATHWAKDYIDFVASRGLISGTGATTFSPDTAITRGDFLMSLGKLSGADVSSYKVSSFTDIKNTSPVMPYIEWAVKNGIAQGIGGGKFEPEMQITREQMAVIMVNYAKATGYTLPVSRQAVTFADDTKISSWASAAVKTILRTGVINGKNGNLFDPSGYTTRAEASAILHRFVELVIDESTARGWSQNDSGQRQYFNADGSLAR